MALNQSRMWSPDPVIDAMQTGDRLSYRPQSARVEMERYPEAYSRAAAAVQKMAERGNLPDEELAKFLQAPSASSEAASVRLQIYRTNVTRARIQVEDGLPARAKAGSL